MGRPPGADADQTRTAILDAALAAFAQRGYDGASIRDITGAAGVGHNLARHYFGSKHELWRAALHHGLDDAAARLQAILEAGTAGEAERSPLQESIESLIDVVAVNPDAVRVLVAEALVGGERFDEIFDGILAPLGASLVRYLRTAETAVDVDARMLGLFAFGAVFASMTAEGFRSRLGVALDDSEQGRRAASQLAELVLHGLVGRGADRHG